MDNIVTGFPSWKGQAEPAAPYASELGNRLLFGLHIVSTDAFSISNLSFVGSSDDGNSLGFAFGAGAYNYSNDYVGINYGADGEKGGLGLDADVRITSGPNTQLVHEVVGRGSGNAWAVYDTSGPIGASRQEKIDFAASALGEDPINFTGVYSLGASTGSGSVTLNPAAVPVPAALPAGLALFGLVAAKRKFWKRQQA
jgi:hypothetical protein